MGKLSPKVNEDKRVLVAMSGGVDSSVAAALLQKASLPAHPAGGPAGRQGYSVEGAYMQCWTEGPYCSTEIDRADALRVAAQLGIPFHVFDFEGQYKDAVLDYFFSEYEAGRTPNPDVACNREIKFGIFLKKALEMGFDYIATGHYARVEKSKFQNPNSKKEDREVWNYRLLKGVDPDKDQSYFLYTLGQEQLKHTLFPIGEYYKKEVRQIAASLGLPIADKKDSQGICFIGPVNVRDFLRQNLKRRAGNIVTSGGEVLGEHDGLAFYTIGQREGLRINSTLPHYVASKNRLANEIVAAPIGSKELFVDSARLSKPNWVEGRQPKLPFYTQVSLRYRQKPTSGVVKKDQAGLVVSFDNAQPGVTAGQAAVFYQGEELFGGATIES